MRKSIWAGLLAAMMVFSSAAQAADKKIVLQLSDGDPAKQTLVLNVATNLQKAYGLANTEIEVVAFGPGLKLLLANNKNKGRIANLAANNITFSACGNTMKKMAKKTGKPVKLNPAAKEVKAGVVQIISLQEKGYMLIRP